MVTSKLENPGLEAAILDFRSSRRCGHKVSAESTATHIGFSNTTDIAYRNLKELPLRGLVV